MTPLAPYVVLYRDTGLLPADAPLAFACEADDTDRAQEQCENFLQGDDDGRVVWVAETANLEAAYADYFG